MRPRPWEQACAREHQYLALAPLISAAEVRELREARWQVALEEAFGRQVRYAGELALAAKGAPWKIEVARALRLNATAPHAWIAAQLRMGTASSVRTHLCRRGSKPGAGGARP